MQTHREADKRFDDWHFFLKDSIRQEIDFYRTAQNRGETISLLIQARLQKQTNSPYHEVRSQPEPESMRRYTQAPLQGAGKVPS
jgi:hypothetical protein